MRTVGRGSKYFIVGVRASCHLPRFLHVPSSEVSFKTSVVDDDLTLICCLPPFPSPCYILCQLTISMKKLNETFPLKLKMFELPMSALILRGAMPVIVIADGSNLASKYFHIETFQCDLNA